MAIVWGFMHGWARDMLLALIAAALLVIASGYGASEAAPSPDLGLNTSVPRVVTVHVESHTRLHWQVPAAVALWDDGLTVVRVIMANCEDDTPCIEMRDTTEMEHWGTTSHYGGADSDITLNRALGRTVSPLSRRRVVCHELGHALGLWWHRGEGGSRDDIYDNSCMGPKGSGPDHLDLAEVDQQVRDGTSRLLD